MKMGILGRIGTTIEGELVKRRVVNHSASANRERDTELGLLLEIGAINTGVLAYLSMAIEAKLNILIVGNANTGKKQLMFALSHLIQDGEKVLVYGDGTTYLNYKDNFVHFVSGGIETETALSNNADRIIMQVTSGKEARVIFDCANHGIPFIATMETSTNGKEVLGRLESKRIRVPKHNINMLDLCILMDHGESSVWKLQSIMEYSWLSRAEYFLDDAKNIPDFQFKVTPSVQKGLLGREALRTSKVFRAFGDYNIMSREEVAEEFENRVKKSDQGSQKIRTP